MFIRTLAANHVDLHWIEHGDPASSHRIVCVHGLTRNAHDFDRLGRALAKRGALVLAVDVPGRGQSSWLDEPMKYVTQVYADVLHSWMEATGASAVDWVGTSMGGMIGMEVAGRSDSPIARLVLNDIGAWVPAAALAPIEGYLGLDLSFEDLDAAERHLRAIHAGFGRNLDDAWWQALARHSTRLVEGRWRMHYDPAIRLPFAKAGGANLDLWALYKTVHCPTLLIRGADSMLLPAAVAEAMTLTGPKAELLTFEGCGHAPSLAEPDQISAIANWLFRSADMI